MMKGLLDGYDLRDNMHKGLDVTLVLVLGTGGCVIFCSEDFSTLRYLLAVRVFVFLIAVHAAWPDIAVEREGGDRGHDHGGVQGLVRLREWGPWRTNLLEREGRIEERERDKETERRRI